MIAVGTMPDAARAPSHPDHARWVREQMLAREVAWLRSVGLEVRTRQVEQVVDRGMQRLEARKREGRLRQPQRRPRPAAAPQNAASSLARREGYNFARTPIARPATAAAPPPWLCGRCGQCVRCRRERRAMNILRMARAGDEGLKPLATILIGAAVRAQAGLGEFAGLGAHDVNRILTRIVEDVCDRSTSIGGPWR